MQATRLEVERDGEQHHAGRHARVSPEEEHLLAGGLDHHALQRKSKHSTGSQPPGGALTVSEWMETGEKVFKTEGRWGVDEVPRDSHSTRRR